MRVYLPFDDGSSVSFDGENFTVHRRPLGIDEPDGQEDTSKAAKAWKEEWRPVVQALESAWRRQQEAHRNERTKKVYSAGR